MNFKIGDVKNDLSLLDAESLIPLQLSLDFDITEKVFVSLADNLNLFPDQSVGVLAGTRSPRSDDLIEGLRRTAFPSMIGV